jgi:transposase InsO family protein
MVVLALKLKVAELERIIGQKQLLIDFMDKMIVLAEETYGVEIKKKIYPTNSVIWQDRRKNRIIMNMLYESLCITKQAFHQYIDRQRVILSEQGQLLLLIYQIREDHPTMGARDMYFKLNIDCFSRRIVGHSVSQRQLSQHTTIPALKMAISLRKREKQDENTLIIHSDGGGQYYSKDFRELTNTYNIANSMCEYAWENGKAERINGVIKNNYLRHRSIDSFDKLKKEADRCVYLYNNDKPHIKLQRKTPVGFETSESKNNKQINMQVNPIY